MKDFLKEIIRLWWVEAGTELKNPKSEASIKALKTVLREDLELDSEFIDYIVDSVNKTPTNFVLHGDHDSGIKVGKNQTAVSAKIHPDWDDEDLNEDDDLNEANTFSAINTKSGQTVVFKTQQSKDTAISKGTHTEMDGSSPKEKKTTPPPPENVGKQSNAFKDDLKNAQTGEERDADVDATIQSADSDTSDSTAKQTVQSNGYVGDKDKSLKQGDATKTEEFQKELPPDDVEFTKKNTKYANPTPPEPYKMPDFLDNPKFPKKYLKALERMMNTQPKGNATKWEHYSDLPGGAGQVSAQAGELMTMMGSTMSDDEWNKFSKSMLAHEDSLKETNPDTFMKKDKKGKYTDNPGSRIVDASWIKAATQSRNAIKNRLVKQYGAGVEITAGAWDTKDDVEAMGLDNYSENKGFSTDMYLKVKLPNGKEVMDEISLKKSTKVNFLNSGAGVFSEWDKDLPDEINQNVYRNNQRNDLANTGNKMKSDIEKLIVSNSPQSKKLNAMFKSKGIDFNNALEDTMKGKGSRAKSKIILESIKALSDWPSHPKGEPGPNANPTAVAHLIKVTEVQNRFQSKAISAITENPKMKDGMMNTIRNEFPLKAVSEGEETMAIGPNSLDKDTMKAIFGTDDYDKIKENLVAEEGPAGPFIGYKVEASGEVFPVADIVIREDGVGYGGQMKFEMRLNQKQFAKRLEKAQSEVYSDKT